MKVYRLLDNLRDYGDFELIFSFTDGVNTFPNMRGFKINNIEVWRAFNKIVLTGVEEDDFDCDGLLVKDLKERLVDYEGFDIEFRFIDMHKETDISVSRDFTIDGVDDIGHSSKEVLLGGIEK